jgi:hypothetical protein
MVMLWSFGVSLLRVGSPASEKKSAISRCSNLRRDTDTWTTIKGCKKSESERERSPVRAERPELHVQVKLKLTSLREHETPWIFLM